jgi:dedicator of cytokinesis protein 3
VCAEAFPTVLRRSEVVEIRVAEISPIENALNDVETKTRELEELEKRYLVLANTERATINSNPLSMALNVAVDAPKKEGGVPLYRRGKTFLDVKSKGYRASR